LAWGIPPSGGLTPAMTFVHYRVLDLSTYGFWMVGIGPPLVEIWGFENGRFWFEMHACMHACMYVCTLCTSRNWRPYKDMSPVIHYPLYL